jgi:hypothetical protein
MFVVAMVLTLGMCGQAKGIDPRIRFVDSHDRALLERGCGQSATFLELAARVEQSDLIVRTEYSEPAVAVGRTVIIGAAGGRRYIVITLSRCLPAEALVALLGHELQHAVEIADAPEVVNDATLRAFYGRIGIGQQTWDGRWQFDTDAAVATGRHVLQEISGHAAAHPY